MATGDKDDMLARLKSLLPSRWFADVAPQRDAVIGAIGSALSSSYSLLAYAKAQARLSTATDFWLDLAAFDYFGLRIKRMANEIDALFRKRIIAEILRPRVTRAAISKALFDLTGKTPDIFEPWNPSDCGAYGYGTLAYAGGKIEQSVTGYGFGLGGYGVGSIAYLVPMGPYGSSPGAGCWGSLALPNHIFVNVHRGTGIVKDAALLGGYGLGGQFGYAGGPPIGSYGGWGSFLGGYGIGATSFAVVTRAPAIGAGFWGNSDTGASISNADIYSTVANTVAAGVIAWTKIDT